MDSASHNPSAATAAQRSADSTLSERPIGRRRGDRIVGASASLQRSVEQASLVARSDAPVCIAGPSGCGRQHLARAIHEWSPRAAGGLVVLRAGSTPQASHARELFGAQPGGEPLTEGGFDGALGRAAGGTLLIVDADRLAPAARDALAQAVRDGEFHRDGDSRIEPLRTRLLLVSSPDGAASLASIASQTIHVEPLSERVEDILPLAVHFLAEVAEEEGATPVGFTSDARRCLVEEPWPGNVRELRERVRQGFRLAHGGALSVESLALSSDGDAVPSFKEAKRSFETRYVRSLLHRCGGNISRAARLAKKDRKDFYDVIRRTGVDPQEFRR